LTVANSQLPGSRTFFIKPNCKRILSCTIDKGFNPLLRWGLSEDNVTSTNEKLIFTGTIIDATLDVFVATLKI